MDKQYRNIYQIARESKGITQEKASELMDISVDSLRVYESGRRVPPNHIVAKMVEIYDTQYLAYQHIKADEVGKCILPDINIKNLSACILSVHTEIKDFLKLEDSLMEIGADDKVDKTEIDTFSKAVKELDDIVKAIMELKFSK